MLSYDEIVCNLFKSGVVLPTSTPIAPPLIEPCSSGVFNRLHCLPCEHCKYYRNPPIQVFDEVISCLETWIKYDSICNN